MQAGMPALDHKALNHWIAKSRKAAPLATFPENLLVKPPKVDRAVIDTLEPLTVAKVPNGAPPETIGHMMTPDGRLALRVILQSEAERFGVDGLTYREGANLLLRLEQMADLETAALSLQRDVVKLRRSLAELHAAAVAGDMPTSAAMVRAATALREVPA